MGFWEFTGKNDNYMAVREMSRLEPRDKYYYGVRITNNIRTTYYVIDLDSLKINGAHPDGLTGELEFKIRAEKAPPYTKSKNN
ncbi:MAG: hypothetical protein ABIE22_00950 [archaeon]